MWEETTLNGHFYNVPASLLDSKIYYIDLLLEIRYFLCYSDQRTFEELQCSYLNLFCWCFLRAGWINICLG